MSNKIKIGEKHVIEFDQNSYDNKINMDCINAGCLNHNFKVEFRRLDRLEKVNGKWQQSCGIIKNKNI